ncbi:ras-like GTP-binding protein Rho1 [Daphnia pulex]|uniref:ras-like GTP-binding protein Rho1 n=1 Tax=Daphnia pulex TaxID=6669 RepID=UPI001EDFDF9D|nr:ras-like GTP-binding protein Rho1 [Daphnia pulex]
MGKHINIVIIGVSGCGKTSPLTVFENDKFPEVYVPTKLGTRVVNITIRDEKVKLELWKPFGQTLYDRQRPLKYQDANVIILRYSINDRSSLEKIANKWTNELKNECSNALIILIGNKKDLRNHPETIEGLAQMGQLPMELGEGVVMIEEIGLYA